MTPDFEFNDCMSVHTPDVGIRPARAHQVSADVGVNLYLEMLAQSALPDKRPNRARDLAPLRRSACGRTRQLPSVRSPSLSWGDQEIRAPEQTANGEQRPTADILTQSMIKRKRPPQ